MDPIIKHNREALLRLIAALFAQIGISAGEVVEALPRHLRRAILLVLRPAESAVRRLAILTADGMELEPLPERAMPERAKRGVKKPGRIFGVPLLDPLPQFSAKPFRKFGAGPRISVPGLYDPVFPPEPTPDDPIPAERLCGRLNALQRALDDLPRMAQRLLRWKARREAQRAAGKPGRTTGLRPGWPPGYRQRQIHPVDEILRQCHIFACRALNPPEVLNKTRD